MPFKFLAELFTGAAYKKTSEYIKDCNDTPLTEEDPRFKKYMDDMEGVLGGLNDLTAYKKEKKK